MGSAVAAGLLLGCMVAADAAAAQSVLDRPPNLSGGWVGRPGQLHFNFLHRFQVFEPAKKVANSPTFFLTASLPGRVVIGGVYASNSLTAPFDPSFQPNEFEGFVRVTPLRESLQRPLGVSLQAGFNTAVESFDGEVTVSALLGKRLRVMAAARGFSDGYGSGDARAAVAGGATVRLTEHVALAGDIASLLDRRLTADGSEEEVAWGAGLQIRIPATPHTISLQATSTHTGTLQGTSRGDGTVRYGFEFTIPITLARYFGSPAPPRVPPTRDLPEAVVSGAVVESEIRDFAFGPSRVVVAAGTTVRWTNRDPVQHSVTADDESWNSGLIDPGAAWTRTFSQPGTYAFHCTPHPFMSGVVVVR